MSSLQPSHSHKGREGHSQLCTSDILRAGSANISMVRMRSCIDTCTVRELGSSPQPPFLAIPTKRASALPELPNQLLNYISTHFRDTHPEAFKNDVNVLVGMRKEWVEPKNEAHPEIVRGLMRYVVLISGHCIVQAVWLNPFLYVANIACAVADWADTTPNLPSWRPSFRQMCVTHPS